MLFRYTKHDALSWAGTSIENRLSTYAVWTIGIRIRSDALSIHETRCAFDIIVYRGTKSRNSRIFFQYDPVERSVRGFVKKIFAIYSSKYCWNIVKKDVTITTFEEEDIRSFRNREEARSFNKLIPRRGEMAASFIVSLELLVSITYIRISGLLLSAK